MIRRDVPTLSLAARAWVLVCPACGLRGTWALSSHPAHPGAQWHDCTK